MKLAIVCTHPIQYYAPVFKELAEQISLKVFYSWGEESMSKFDPGFQKEIVWDIPLLDGYAFEFLRNTATDPGTHHFSGIKNPDAIEAINLYKPDAILVYGWAYRSHLKILRHYKGKIPVFFRGDSTLLDPVSAYKQFIKDCMLKWVYSHVDKAFYVGNANKAYFLRHGLSEEQLIFAPHAIDNQRFERTVPQPQSIRTLLGINEDSIVILFAGKFESKKDPEILLNAFSDANLNNIEIIFVGNGLLESKLKALGAGSSKAANIHFLDFQNQADMPSIYASCDLFCLPSIGPGETWGLAVNEAMACAKAVLVSDRVGCAKDLVKDGVNGTIFRAGNRKDLMNKLYQLCQSKTELMQMGIQSKAIIANWSIEKQVDYIAAGILKTKGKNKV